MSRLSLRPLRGVLCIALAIAFLTLLTGCPGEPDVQVPAPSSEPLFDLTIDVAVPQGLGLREAWQLLLDEWSAQTGANVRLREYDAEQYGVPLSMLLRIEETRSGWPTLFVVPVTRIAELAVDGAAMAIPSEQKVPENLNWNDIFEGLRGSANYGGRNEYFVPVSAPALVCYYRRDLLEKAGLSPPATWSDYQKLLDTMGNWAPGLSAVEPWGEDYRATLFLARAAAFAKHPANVSYCFDINTGEPLVEHPGFVRALEASRAALAKLPPDVRKYSERDCRRELLSGRAALGIALETGPDNSPLAFGPDWVNWVKATADRSAAEPPAAASQPDSVDLACVRLPGSPEVYNTTLNEWESPRGKTNYSSLTGFGGLAIGVAARCSSQEALAAWNMVGTLTLGNIEHAFPASLRSVVRESQVPDGPRWLGDELRPSTAQSYIGAVEASLADAGLAIDLPVIERARIRAVLTEELGRFIDGSGTSPTPQETLGNIARRWRAMTQEIGLARVHNSYRGALGFHRSSEPAE